jgi:hypothetical protein
LFFCACSFRPVEQAPPGIDQQPRQMPFSLRSIVLFSSLMAASSLVCGHVPAPADPVVTPRPPDDCAVPAELVPGGGGEARWAEFPAPLGSAPAPGLAGAEGTPPMPDVPAPAEPAFGEPVAAPLPDGPLVLCANERTGDVKIAIAAAMATLADALFIGNLP